MRVGSTPFKIAERKKKGLPIFTVALNSYLLLGIHLDPSDESVPLFADYLDTVRNILAPGDVRGPNTASDRGRKLFW
ncbi:hypothetical protein BgiBS90_029230 [Biomphalaria glabrata]|nr:hypothetical protein BgiBS90_029230 [Biomphalaria glabrata]